MPKKLEEHLLYAWIGEDELGSGRLGIKQFITPAGYIPLVAMDYDLHKLAKLRAGLQEQANQYGKTIHLVRLRVDGIADVIKPRES